MSQSETKSEYKRLIQLYELDLDYTELQGELEIFTKLSAQIAGTEISLINLIDDATQWSVARYGIDISQMPKESSICDHTVAGGEPLESNNLSEDPRFMDKFYVCGGPELRYYFGVPLITSGGAKIGALCVLGKEPKELKDESKDLLKLLATQVVKHLEMLHRVSLLEAAVSKSEMIKTKIAHDIRSPLSGILGVVDLLKLEIQEANTDKVLELLSMVEKSGEHILELADAILDEEAEIEIEESQYDLITFSKKLDEMYRPQAFSKDLDLRIIVVGPKDTTRFSKKYLLQIAGNLISNSIKFTPEKGSVLVQLSILKGSSEESDSSLEICVKDTGVGMSHEKIDEIQSGLVHSKIGTKGEDGYGLGLNSVVDLVARRQGSVTIQSEEGQGSEFEISIPI